MKLAVFILGCVLALGSIYLQANVKSAKGANDADQSVGIIVSLLAFIIFIILAVGNVFSCAR